MTHLFRLLFLLCFLTVGPSPLLSEETPSSPPTSTRPEPKRTPYTLTDESPDAPDTLNGRGTFGQELTHMLMMLGLLVIFLLGASWLLKRLFNQRLQTMNESSRIKIMERRSLSPKAAIYLIEVEGRRVVLAESPAGLRPIADFSSTTTFQDTYQAAGRAAEEKEED